MCGGPCTRTNLTLRHQTEVLRNAFRHLRGAPGTLVSGVAAHNTTTSRGSAGHALEGKEVASFEPRHVERAVRFLRPPCNTLGFHLLQRCTAGGWGDTNNMRCGRAANHSRRPCQAWM